MMPPSVAALLGARIDGIDPSPLVAGAYFLACALLLYALWSRATRTGNRFAMAGITLAVGAAIYSHDVVNLPEIVSALTIGGGIGLMLARRGAVRILPWLVVSGHGLLGLGAMATAFVLFRNPFAFAIVRDDGAMLPGDGLLLAAAFAIGALVLGGALTMAVRRTQVGLAWLGSGSGWAAAALGFALGNSAMVVAGAMAGVAAARIGWRADRAAPRA